MHARHLISPHQWSNFNISSTAFEELKTRHEIQLLFSKIGYDFETYFFNALFEKASNGSEKCSINQFRDVMNNDIKISSVNSI